MQPAPDAASQPAVRPWTRLKLRAEPRRPTRPQAHPASERPPERPDRWALHAARGAGGGHGAWPVDAGRGGPCRGSRRARHREVTRGARVRVQGLRVSAWWESRAARAPREVAHAQEPGAKPSARRPAGRAAALHAACSPRIRAPRTLRRHPHPHTSRPRRRASGQRWPRAAASPLHGRARRSCRPSAAHGPEPSSACGGRTARAPKLPEHE